MANKNWIDRRPRLPEFDPVYTPDPTDLESWHRIVEDKMTRRYSAETLLRVRDVALTEGENLLSKLLYNEIWTAGKRRIKAIVSRFDITFDDPARVIDGAKDYLRLAIDQRTRPEDGKPYRNYVHIRDGFDRFLGKRCLDALKVRWRLATSEVRAAQRAEARGNKIGQQLRQAIDGRRSVYFDLISDPTNKKVIELLLEGDHTWKEIAEITGLPSGEAARKRYERIIKRLMDERRK